MKTNRSARNNLRVRLVVAFLVLIGLAGVAFKTGQNLGKQSARARVANVETITPPKVDLGSLIASN